MSWKKKKVAAINNQSHQHCVKKNTCKCKNWHPSAGPVCCQYKAGLVDFVFVFTWLSSKQKPAAGRLDFIYLSLKQSLSNMRRYLCVTRKRACNGRGFPEQLTISCARSVADGLQIWLLSEREIKSFVMLSARCLEAKTSPSDVCAAEPAGHTHFFFYSLSWTTVLHICLPKQKGCRSLRLIMKDADTGPGAALKCWLCDCYCLFYSNWVWLQPHHDDS